MINMRGMSKIIRYILKKSAHIPNFLPSWIHALTLFIFVYSSDHFVGLKLSFRETLRLNTSAPGLLSRLSTQK